jgi:outer membrane protein assembly factor BamB
MSSRKKALLAGGVAVVVLIAAGAVYALTHRGGDVFNANVAFNDEPTQTPAPATPEPTKKGKKDPLRNFVWPTYGYTNNRRRYLDASPKVGPPFRRRWYFNAHTLLEFSPSMAQGKLFMVGNDGIAFALDKKTGKLKWRRQIGALAASTPGYGAGWIYVTLLSRGKGKPGAIRALRAKTGKVMWTRNLPSRTESSPVFDNGRVYFGSENGTVFALQASSGKTIWTFKASGAVKGGLALSQGKLYFGDYSGRVYSVQASNGHKVWSTGTSGSLFGLRSGQFYSTPAVGYGRVYVGNTDGRMYSFSADKGKLAWTHGTGSYVYASPALAQVSGGKPLVYFGSYDGTFYACDARSGKVVWQHRDSGKISGSATVIGNVVYYSNLGHHKTLGLNARTGKVVFKRGLGAFNPVISDGRDIFLTGSTSESSLRPRALLAPRFRHPAKKPSHRKSGKRRSGRSKHKAQRQHQKKKRQRGAAARRHHRKQSQARQRKKKSSG